MAIKGKRKPKARSGRAVTAGPRPAYVQPKVAPFQRTGAKFLVALIFEAAIFALLIGFAEQGESDRERERVTEFSVLLEASLSRAGSAVQPLPATLQLLPELPAALAAYQGGEPPEDEVMISQAEAWSASLSRAADGLASLNIPDEDLEPAQRLGLIEARGSMERGLRMFAGLADQLRVAVQIDGEQQSELLAVIQSQIPVATGSFDTGFGRWQEIRLLVGLGPSQFGSGLSPTGLPAGGAPGFPPLEGEVPAELPAGGGGGGNGGGGGGGGGGNG